jgi:sterol desaturase/sphingolipid hydroxylase (fatty acid hydroxylase superfamily)
VPHLIDIFRLGLWLLILAVIIVPLERFWPHWPQKFLRKSFAVDLAYYFLSGFAPKLLLILPLSFLAAVAHHFTGGWFLPIWFRLPAAIFVMEIGAYWGHRWSHEIPVLWRFHAIHHSAEEIDWLVNTRAHPVDLVFTRLCGLVPMYLLGLAQPTGTGLDMVPVYVTIFGTIWGFFIHANLNWRLGWIELLVSSPAFHHWHHTNDGPDLINKNYAALLPWVDKCFGTFYLPKAWPSKYGTDAEMAHGLIGQLVQPFVTGSRQEP